MTTQTFAAQAINEDDLEAVQGGGFWKDVVTVSLALFLVLAPSTASQVSLVAPPLVIWSNDDHLLIEEKRQKAPPRAGFFIACCAL